MAVKCRAADAAVCRKVLALLTDGVCVPSQFLADFDFITWLYLGCQNWRLNELSELMGNLKEFCFLLYSGAGFKAFILALKVPLPRSGRFIRELV
jgi:hypothetical protein